MNTISDMSFWHLSIPSAGKPCRFEIEQTPTTSQYVHVTNVALPPNSPAGPHSLTIINNGAEVTIATLIKDAHPQHALDFVLDQTVEFKNYGKGPMHLIGYQTSSKAEDFDDSEDEDDEETEETDGDGEAPQAVKIPNGPVKGSKDMKQARKIPVQQGATQEDEDDEDDEDYELNSDDVVGEFDDDESDEEGPGGPEGNVSTDDATGSDDEEGDSDDDDEAEEEEDDNDEESEEPTPKPTSNKRPAPSPAAATPQRQALTPAPKKAKTGEDQKQPSSAPPKQQQKQTQQTPGKATPSDEKEYEKALINYLKAQPNKSEQMAKIGSVIQRPKSVPKLQAWIKAKGNQFKLENNNTVVSYIGK